MSASPLQRLKAMARRLRKRAVRPQARRGRTMGERKAAKLLARQFRGDLQTALNEGRQIIWDFAEELHERFKDRNRRSLQWYYRALIGAASRRKRSTTTSQWQAYLSLEVSRMNEGMYFKTPIHNALNLHLCR